MTKLFARVSAISGAIGSAVLPVVAYAQTAGNPFQAAQELSTDVGNQAGITTQRELPEIIGQIINIVLGFLGIVLLLLILYAGFLWMTARGESDKTEEARKIISNAVVGLIIIVAAFAISNFVLGSLVNVTQ